MTERGLLRALDKYRLPLSPAIGPMPGYVIRSRANEWTNREGAILFWAPSVVVDAVYKLGWVGDDWRITPLGRAALEKTR